MYLRKPYNLFFNAIICFKDYSFPIYNYILDYLYEGLQELHTLKQIMSLDIELKCSTSYLS